MHNAPNDMDLLPDGVPAPTQQAPTVSFAMREVFRSRPFWFLTIGEGLAAASLSAGHSIAGWKALELVDSTLLAIFLTIATFVSVCFYLVGGLAGDRFPKYKVLASFAAIQAMGILVLVFAGNMPIISLALAVMSIGAGGLVPLALAIVPDYYGTGSLGIILGIQVFPVALVSTVAPASPLAGWILDVTGSYFLTLLPPAGSDPAGRVPVPEGPATASAGNECPPGAAGPANRLLGAKANAGVVSTPALQPAFVYQFAVTTLRW